MLFQEFSELTIEEQLKNVNTSLTSAEAVSQDQCYLSMLCKLYEPNEKYVQLKEYLESNATLTEDFILLISKIPDSNLYTLSIKLIARLSGFENTLADYGCTKKLIHILFENKGDRNIVLNGVKALSFLLCEQNVIERIFEETPSVIVVLVKLLQAYTNDDPVCVLILASILNCLYRRDRSKITFMEEGGLAEILHFQLSANRVQVFQMVTRLLRNLCKQDDIHRAWIINEEFFKYVVEISLLFMDDAVIQENIIWILLNVTLNSRTAKGLINRIRPNNGIVCISRILHTHAQNEEIQKFALTLFNQISTRTTTRVAVAKEYGIAELMKLLFAWESNHEIQLMCLKVIDVLCTLSLCRRRLAQEGRLQALVNWLCQNVGDKHYVSCGLNIFHKLSISASESKEALQQNGGFSMFSKINSFYHDDLDILDITLKTQQNLVTPADYESEDSEEDVPSSASSDGDEEDDEDDVEDES